MKKYYLSLFFFLMSILLFAQKIEGNKISHVYEVSGVKAEEIFSKINFAVSLIYQNPNDVIKFKDDHSNRMVIKAVASVPVLDAYKLMNPNNSNLSDYIDYKHNYTIVIAVRDEKYRIELIYQDGKYSDSQLTEYKLPFSAKMDYIPTDIEEIIKQATQEMNQEYYGSTSKKKKEIYIQSQPRVVRQYQQTLKDYAIIFFQTLYKKVLDDLKQEDW